MKTLWAFQREDVDALAEVKSILFGHDMGCGKTLEAVERDARIRKKAWMQGGNRVYPTLIVAPKSTLFDTWYGELAEYYGWGKMKNGVFVVPNTGTPASARSQFLKALQQNDHTHYVIHWQAIPLLVDDLKKNDIRFLHIIGDEIQNIKNRKAKVSIAFKKIPTIWKTALSATPADDKPSDWWSPLNWLYPEKYTSYWKWVQYYCDYDKTQNYQTGQSYRKFKGIISGREEEFHDDLSPFYRRHMKREMCCDAHPEGVLPDLPDKIYTTRVVELLPTQRRAYEEMKDNLVSWVQSATGVTDLSSIRGEGVMEPMAAQTVVAKLVRLQQFCVGSMQYMGDKPDPKGRENILGEPLKVPVYRMIDPSAKLDLAEEILEQAAGQVVVFSQFKQAIDLLVSRLELSGTSHRVLTSGVSQRDRDTAIRDFRAGRAKVFTSTILAGGIGTNLQSADVVVFLDRTWSPAKNLQAEDRVWRAGQKNTVQIIDIVARNTIDAGRLQQIEDKWTALLTTLIDPRIKQRLLAA